MTTARDQLLSEAFGLFKRSYSLQAKSSVDELLDRYRIQAKPTTKLPEGCTAREALGVHLLSLWKEGPKSSDQELKTLIDRYRMQAKQAKLLKRQNAAKDTNQAKRQEEGGQKKSIVGKPGSAKSRSKQILVKKSHLSSEPVGGGPLKRHGARGECPKCHSKGVVLARSYAGDEYFSCIYCGFQAYAKNVDHELDMPLALELLGRRFDDKGMMEEPMEEASTDENQEEAG